MDAIKISESRTFKNRKKKKNRKYFLKHLKANKQF